MVSSCIVNTSTVVVHQGPVLLPRCMVLKSHASCTFERLGRDGYFAGLGVSATFDLLHWPE